MSDETFWQDIIEKAGGEALEGVVIGGFGWSYDNEPDDDDDNARAVAQANKGRVLSAAEAEPLLSYAYDPGFGGADCHAIYAWTANRVLSVHEYDGSTRVIWVPRNPTNGTPEMC